MSNPFQKMRLLVARGLVGLVNDSTGLQELQVEALADEPRGGIERAQNFGLSSHPPKGSIPILVAVGGSRDHLVAVAVDNSEIRPKELKEGEVKVYSAFDSFMYFDEEGNVRLKCKKFIIDASEKTEVNTPEATFSEMATVNGLFSFNNGMAGREGENGIALHGQYYITGEIIINGIALSTHTHSGVEVGGGNTGAPN